MYIRILGLTNKFEFKKEVRIIINGKETSTYVRTYIAIVS